MPPADPAAPKPAEERSYLAFAAAALFFVLVAGLALGIGIPLAHGAERLVQAHAATQLQGWIGLFVAGMSLRLVPRLSGRRPFSTALTASVLVLLVAGVLLRIAAAWAAVLLVPSAVAWACGSAVLAFALGAALLSRGRTWQAWRLAAWAGAAWWVPWAALGVAGAVRSSGGLVPEDVDVAWEWVGVIGALSNFVWAVESRSVPVFYGRRVPGALGLGPPLLLLNAGAVLILVSTFGPATLLVGLGLAGVAIVWLAPLAGSVWGRAHRLRPVSRPASRYILAANLWAVLGGVLLVASAVAGISGRPESGPLRDAALHALGLGLMTTLVLGMAQLLTPIFAGERIAVPHRRPELALSFPFLVAATALRVAGSAFGGELQAAVIAASGVLAWLALAAFAAGVARVTRTAAAGQAPREPQGTPPP